MIVAAIKGIVNSNPLRNPLKSIQETSAMNK